VSRNPEPLEPIVHALAAQFAFQAHNYAKAVDHANQALLIDPHFWVGFMQLGQAYKREGKTDLALKALMNAERFSGRNSKAVSTRGYALAKAGKTKEARDVLRTLEARSQRGQYVPAYSMALVNAGLDEPQAVFTWLDRAYEARDVHLIFLSVDPKWDPYRTDPRFQEVLERCGFLRPGERRP
jgi:tetratricopeptide (TPR) repeat protein